MKTFPTVDLASKLPSAIEVQLQDAAMLRAKHAESEDIIPFYAGANNALSTFVTPRLAGSDLKLAFNDGITAYGVISARVHPTGQQVVLMDAAQTTTAITKLLNEARSAENLTKEIELAYSQLCIDTSRLTATVKEIVGRQCGYDDTKIGVALRGSAAMRAIKRSAESSE